MKRTEERVAAVVSQVTRVAAAQLHPDADLRVACNVDSLLALQIIAAIEIDFGIEVPEDVMAECTTIRDITGIVETLSAERPACS